jgi:hypothetical protein
MNSSPTDSLQSSFSDATTLDYPMQQQPTSSLPHSSSPPSAPPPRIRSMPDDVDYDDLYAFSEDDNDDNFIDEEIFVNPSAPPADLSRQLTATSNGSSTSTNNSSGGGVGFAQRTSSSNASFRLSSMSPAASSGGGAGSAGHRASIMSTSTVLSKRSSSVRVSRPPSSILSDAKFAPRRISNSGGAKTAAMNAATAPHGPSRLSSVLYLANEGEPDVVVEEDELDNDWWYDDDDDDEGHEGHENDRGVDLFRSDQLASDDSVVSAVGVGNASADVPVSGYAAKDEVVEDAEHADERVYGNSVFGFLDVFFCFLVLVLVLVFVRVNSLWNF